MKMEYLPRRNESKMQVDYSAAIAMFFCDYYLLLTFGPCASLALLLVPVSVQLSLFLLHVASSRLAASWFGEVII